MLFIGIPPLPPASLPSRGAWIEMLRLLAALFGGVVAPLAGSVDRNFQRLPLLASAYPSLPSRGAWIEM